MKRSPGRPRIADEVKAEVFAIRANAPRLSARKIADQLTPEGVASERTIRRWLEEFDKKKSPEFRDQFRQFYWPESMEKGLLPWEASRAGLDLLCEYQKRGWYRPLLAVVRAYSDVLNALPFERDDGHDREPVRWAIAHILAAVQLVPSRRKGESLREIETFLASRKTDLQIKVPKDVERIFRLVGHPDLPAKERPRTARERLTQSAEKIDEAGDNEPK